MKSVMMFFLFAVIAILAKQANAGINLQSWQCQFSKNGDRTEEWISSTTGQECLKNKEAGYVLYRATIFAKSEKNIADLSLSVFLDTIGEADEAYVDNKLIGKTGGFPPIYLNSMHRPRMYLLGNSNELNGHEFFLKVYSEFPVNRGLDLSKVKVGTHSELSKSLFWKDFKSTTSLPLILTLFLLTTFFTFFIYIQKSQKTIHLWAAATSLFMASYTFFLSRYGYELNFSNLHNYRALVSSAMLVAICLSAFSYSLAKSKFSKVLLALGSLNIIYLLYIQTFSSVLQFRSAYKNWFILFVVIVVVMICHFLVLSHKNAKAKFMLIGTMIFFGAAINDITITLGIRIGTNIAHYGLASFAVTFLLSEIHELLSEIKMSVLVEAESKTKKAISQAIVEQNAQVAHDIRSPLAALNMIMGQFNNAPENQRIIMRSAISRINDIANKLLVMGTYKQNMSSVTDNNQDEVKLKFSTQLLSPLIDMIVSEKRIQYREKQEIEIEANLNLGYGLFVNIDQTELKRTVSNILNNSIEAMPNNKGRVSVVIQGNDNFIDLVIQDNGKGIPDHILQKLGNMGVSHGKEGTESGTGLGIYHAKKTIESFGGKIEILSTEGHGTIITMSFPKAVAPKWFVDKLSLRPSVNVISLDDDLSIHQIWKDRFESIKIFEFDIGHLTFTSGMEFKSFVKANKENQLYLVDYELLNQDQTGLDIIEELGIGIQSILVTSRYEEENIKERCEKLGVRLIPKAMAPFVPIEIQKAKRKYDIILIDDDELVRLTWEMKAKKTGNAILSLSSSVQLLEQIIELDIENTFYIDVHLSNGESGVDLSHELYKLGFLNLYLATGYEPDNFQHVTWIKGIVGKNPNWS